MNHLDNPPLGGFFILWRGGMGAIICRRESRQRPLPKMFSRSACGKPILLVLRAIDGTDRFADADGECF
jgi:hypothetical protein